jgi:hypothetical protein
LPKHKNAQRHRARRLRKKSESWRDVQEFLDERTMEETVATAKKVAARKEGSDAIPR